MIKMIMMIKNQAKIWSVYAVLELSVVTFNWYSNRFCLSI